jgi:hypothetical protein
MNDYMTENQIEVVMPAISAPTARAGDDEDEEDPPPRRRPDPGG